MSAVYISIEKNAEVFEMYKMLWGNRGITGVRVDTMTEAIETAVAIEKSKTKCLYFIDIVANDIDFMPQLAILNEVTDAPILIATSHYDEDEHHKALNNGTDFYAQYCDEPEKNIHGVITYKTIYRRIWGGEYEDAARDVLWSAITRLRKKLKTDQNGSEYIETVLDVGYRF